MNFSSELRDKLAEYSERYAKRWNHEYYWSLGKKPTLLLPTPSSGITPNIIPAAANEIRNRKNWMTRLDKPHSQKKALPKERQALARELESSNSSDALLMNVFCVPDLPKSLLKLLPCEVHGEPAFGFHPKLKLLAGKKDNTEVDMLWGGMLVEAKLTEIDFTKKELKKVLQYEDVEKVFDLSAITLEGHIVQGYQLIRNVLTARMMNKNLVVILDQRRPDLLRQWWEVHSAIKDSALRMRSSFLTWQELCRCLRSSHRELLVEKYGI